MGIRKSWDQHWIEVVYHTADMCTCAGGRNVGAVFVADNRVLVTGFNGVPHNFPHPASCKRRDLGIPSGEKIDMCGCVHAEQNGINNAARAGVSLLGSTLYCTTEPCTMCMGSLVNVGISKVVYVEAYPNTLSTKIARRAGIYLHQYVIVDSEV